jgi:hypothetical protein
MGMVQRFSEGDGAQVRHSTARHWGAAASLTIGLLASGAASAHSKDNGERYQLLRFSGHYVKWGDQAFGQGAVVTYAFADRTMRFRDAVNCGRIVPVDTLAARNDIALETLHAETAAAFRVWEQAADIQFVAIDNAADADIVIGAQAQPTGRAFANVSYRPPESGNSVKAIERSLICLNPEQPWKVGFDGDTDVYDIRYTMVHEIGHAIGLDHPSPSGQVMSFRYTEEFHDLQPGDLRGAAVLYGHGDSHAMVAEQTPHEHSSEDRDSDGESSPRALSIGP